MDKKAVAKLNYLRISPRKVRLVANLIRGKQAYQALSILEFTTKKAAQPLQKLLNSALANAKNNFQAKTDNLFVSKITVGQGPTLKRWRPRAMGRADEIKKRTSHITLVLKERKETKKQDK